MTEEVGGIIAPIATALGFAVAIGVIVVLALRLKVDRWVAGVGVRVLPGATEPPGVDALCESIQEYLWPVGATAPAGPGAKMGVTWRRLRKRLVLQFHPKVGPMRSAFVPTGLIDGQEINGTFDVEGVLLWKRFVVKVRTDPTRWPHAADTAAAHEIAQHLVPFLERGDHRGHPACKAVGTQEFTQQTAIERRARG